MLSNQSEQCSGTGAEPPVGFFRYAESHGDDTALVLPDGRTVSYGQLRDRADRISHLLTERGLRHGDVVAALLPNGEHLLAVQLAAEQVGLHFTPVNWHLTAEESGYILKDSRARIVFTHPRFAEQTRRAADLAGLAEEDRICTGQAEGYQDLGELCRAHRAGPPPLRSAGAVQYYSSGTTGKPKGIRRALPKATPEEAHQALVQSRRGSFGFRLAGEVNLVVAPLYHAAPNASALLSLHMGHTLVLTDRFDAEGALRLIEQHRVTIGFMVPIMFQRMLHLAEETRSRYDVSSLRVITHSGAPCPDETKRAMLDWFGPVLYEYYGASETGMAVFSTPEQWHEHPGTLGTVLPGFDIVVLDGERLPLPPGSAGEIFIKGGSRFSYFGREAETADQWHGEYFRTGDIGLLVDGRLQLCDRRSDLIISGGVNIYPAEIEAALSAHAAVADAAVIGIPDPEWGQTVIALVEPLDGVETGRLCTELAELCTQRLAGFKQPRRIELRIGLPRTPNGKLSRSRLREEYLAARH
ncbi:AMP-binding protein [Streptomyces sp. NPDC056938]|uniref:AMP-binding protein n=1 Tax=unclassified Streptomyces TaxID=2593676 RepID=UPI003633FE3A